MNKMVNKNYAIAPTNELSNFVLAEVNLEKLPFFAPDKRKKFSNGKLSYTYSKEFVKDGKALKIEWKVSPHPEFGGFPNHFDRDVYRCIQKLATQNGMTNDGFVAFNLLEITELLGRSKSGKLYKEIKKSILKMLTTTIQSYGAFYSKEKKEWIRDSFHVYERFIEKGKELPDGTIADTNYLKVGDWFLKSIKAGYLKPVDFDYYFLLQSSSSKAIYSKLSVDFYGLPDSVSFLKKRYSEFCKETLLTQQKYPSVAKRLLAKPFQELINTQFFEKIEFEPIPDNKNDFYIKFYPGIRSKEPNKFKKIYPKTVEVFDFNKNYNNLSSVIDVVSEFKDEFSEEDQLILQQLLDIDMAETAAKECLKKYKVKTKYWLKAKEVDDKYKAAVNKPGFILMAIKRNWSSPMYEQFLEKEKQKKEVKLQAKCIDIENHQKELDCLNEKSQLDEFYCKLSDSKKKEIDAKIFERLKQENNFLYQQYKKNGLSVGIELILHSYHYDSLKLLKGALN